MLFLLYYYFNTPFSGIYILRYLEVLIHKKKQTVYATVCRTLEVQGILTVPRIRGGAGGNRAPCSFRNSAVDVDDHRFDMLRRIDRISCR